MRVISRDCFARFDVVRVLMLDADRQILVMSRIPGEELLQQLHVMMLKIQQV